LIAESRRLLSAAARTQQRLPAVEDLVDRLVVARGEDLALLVEALHDRA